MHITTHKWSRVLFTPLIKFCEWLGNNHPVTLVKMRYWARFHKFPNLKNPRNINEKILYMKLFTDTSRWTELADKYRVRKYVEECGLGQYLVPLLGVWEDVSKINYDDLPDSFIFKSNNGCGKGSNLMVHNKSVIDKEKTNQILDKWLKEKNVGALAAEPQYKNMKPLVIAEGLLPTPEGQDFLIDYKIWCFNGKAEYIMVCSDRDNDGTSLMTYDLSWNMMPEVGVYSSVYRKGEYVQKPSNLQEMIEVAEKLTKGFPCVRLDLYNIEGKIYFGEMTFTSLGGMMNYYTSDFLGKMGAMIDLNYPSSK